MSAKVIVSIFVLIVFTLGLFTGFAVVNDWSVECKAVLYILDVVVLGLIFKGIESAPDTLK